MMLKIENEVALWFVHCRDLGFRYENKLNFCNLQIWQHRVASRNLVLKFSTEPNYVRCFVDESRRLRQWLPRWRIVLVCPDALALVSDSWIH